MGPRFVGWVCLFSLCGPLAVSAQDDGKPDAGKPPAPAPKKKVGCVEVATEASFASVGYDHIVTLTSACKKPMTCSVKTNVNPDPASVELDPGESQSVVTWRGSPAREFTAEVSCVPTRK